MTRRKVVVLIPAHNEAAQIGATIESLRAQTRVPTSIIVLADHCTDDTASVAAAAGATVIPTVANTAKKAGALNQGLDAVLPMLDDDDFVLLVDADSVLCPDWIWYGIDYLTADPTLGAVSGAYAARRGTGMVSLFQRAEYAQERRRIARRGGRVDVLSGAAVLIPVAILRDLRHTRGFVYDEASLTEDFEMTLAVRALGYSPRCFSDLAVVTDIMDSWGDLARQRIRWQRGTIETLRRYGITPLTRRLWATQLVAYSSTAILFLTLGSWGWVAATGATVDVRWLGVLPVFAAEQAVTTRRAGWAPVLLAVLLVPMWGYQMCRLAVYWVALARSLRRSPAVWS